MANGKSDIVNAIEKLSCVKRAWIEWVGIGGAFQQHLVVEIASTDPSSPDFRTQDISAVNTEVGHQLQIRPIMGDLGGVRIIPEGYY